MANVREVSDESLVELVNNAERPVLVDFWAAWCAPCRALAPEIERLADKYKGNVDFVKVDVEAHPLVYMALQSNSLPTIALFRPGEQPALLFGARPAEMIEAAFGLTEYAAVQS